MGDPVILSWVAIVISVVSAVAGVVAAKSARDATRLQKDEHERGAVRLSAAVDMAATDNVHWALRITNNGHKSIYLTNVQLRDDPNVWDRGKLTEIGADGGSHVVRVAKDDFTIKPGQTVILEWAFRPLTGETPKTAKIVL